MNYRAAVLLLACAAAHAALPEMTADAPGGGRVDLYTEAGPCMGDARRAEYVPANGPAVPGCWVLIGTVVGVVYFDADTGQIPVAAFKKPKTL